MSSRTGIAGPSQRQAPITGHKPSSILFGDNCRIEIGASRMRSVHCDGLCGETERINKLMLIMEVYGIMESGDDRFLEGKRGRVPFPEIPKEQVNLQGPILTHYNPCSRMYNRRYIVAIPAPSTIRKAREKEEGQLACSLPTVPVFGSCTWERGRERDSITVELKERRDAAGQRDRDYPIPVPPPPPPLKKPLQGPFSRLSIFTPDFLQKVLAYNPHEAEADAKTLTCCGAQLVSTLGPRGQADSVGSLLAKLEPCKVYGFSSLNGWVAGAFRQRIVGADIRIKDGDDATRNFGTTCVHQK
ncbi:hypothetical protein ARMSODRAFT_974372 [Armillaria solidipes]|uniref:Uncharacterized protein n=1 Tax=Armillaria solidipes TaxID=1076256 RepID=A0A2H3BHX3_9AGAR|nr:hypothetical protein ARMSODRAFT_974372 [Armillaria solidipes]